MKKTIVTGIGTGVGKTVTSAILVNCLEGDYWKPVETGEMDLDTETVKRWLPHNRIHPSAYSLKAPLSPHHAAKLENIWIDPKKIAPPSTSSPLVIETAGGPLAPLNDQVTSIDLFSKWEAEWIVVANCYLGSINHTLGTIEVLKMRQCKIRGLIFNGDFLKESEEAILSFSKIPLLARIEKFPHITSETLKTVGQEWKAKLSLN